MACRIGPSVLCVFKNKQPGEEWCINPRNCLSIRFVGKEFEGGIRRKVLQSDLIVKGRKRGGL